MDLDLRFPSDARLLKTIRGIVGQLAGVSGFADDEAQFIMLAVDEACANVIRHAYGGKPDGEMLLSCHAAEGRIEFRLIDWGQPVRPERLKPRSLEEVRPGGLGLYLMRSVMDEVSFRDRENGNELYLAKSVRPRTEWSHVGGPRA